MDDKVDLADAAARVAEPWSPRIVARYNDNKVAVARAAGEFVWHRHHDTDDLFLVIAGQLTIELRDRPDVTLGPGQLYVVPRGVEHRPVASEGAHIMLVEPEGTVNTGDAGGPLTAPERDL